MKTLYKSNQHSRTKKVLLSRNHLAQVESGRNMSISRECSPLPLVSFSQKSGIFCLCELHHSVSTITVVQVWITYYYNVKVTNSENDGLGITILSVIEITTSELGDGNHTSHWFGTELAVYITEK